MNRETGKGMQDARMNKYMDECKDEGKLKDERMNE